MRSVESTFNEYKGWIVLVFTVYVLWAFRGLFTALGSTAGAVAEAATAGVRESVETAAGKQKVKVSGGSNHTATAAELAQYDSDAKSLAAMLGHDSFGINTLLKDRKNAFSLLKRSYSRLNLYNNLPFAWGTNDRRKRVPVTQKAETPASVKNPVNWRVLAPFYKDATSGRDLLSDLRSDLDIPEFRPWIKWII